MITFKDFLQEAKHREDISMEKAKELIDAHCHDASKTRPLFRGMSGREEAYLIEGEAGGRESANTTNYYTMLMDHFLPKLGYPKRGKSIICANNANEDYAGGFGNVYALFPYDGVPIGVCYGHDLWETPVEIGNEVKTIQRWNGVWRDNDLPANMYEAFAARIKSNLKAKTSPELTEIFQTPDNVDNELKKAYSVKGLRVHLATTKNIGDYNDKSRELWLGGKCIAIRQDIWETMMKAKA